MGVQLSWQSTCPASRGSSVRTRLPPPLWAHSSAGQSTRLISVRSMVRVHLSPPPEREKIWANAVPTLLRKDTGAKCGAFDCLQSNGQNYIERPKGFALEDAKTSEDLQLHSKQKSIIGNNKTSTKGKEKFSYQLIKLIWLIKAKDVKSNFKALENANKLVEQK